MTRFACAPSIMSEDNSAQRKLGLLGSTSSNSNDDSTSLMSLSLSDGSPADTDRIQVDAVSVITEANPRSDPVKFRGFQRSFSCNYGSCETLPDLTHLLRDSDTWRDPAEVNCFLKNCECTPRSAKTRKISFVRFEDEVTPMETVDEQQRHLDSDSPDCKSPDGDSSTTTAEHISGDVETTENALYSVKEEDLDENENSYQLRETIIHLITKNYEDVHRESVDHTKNEKTEEKQKPIKDEDEKNKKNFFKSIFTRSSTPKIKLKKSVSVMDVSPSPAAPTSPTVTAPPKRQSSFLKKTLDGASKLKRSLSVRKLSSEKKRESLTEVKNREWAASLQSLVETDIMVSYNDLSFVDYDRNGDSYNYDKYLSKWTRRNEPMTADGADEQNNGMLPGNKCIYRTQSMIVNKGNTPHFVRHKSVSSISNWRNQVAASRRHLPENCNGDGEVSERHVDVPVDDDSHAKSLPCLVHKRSKKDRKLRGRSLPYTQAYQECFNVTEWPLEEHETDIDSLKTEPTKTTKLRRQNACRQKSSQHHQYQQQYHHQPTASQCQCQCNYVHSHSQCDDDYRPLVADVDKPINSESAVNSACVDEPRCQSLDLLLESAPSQDNHSPKEFKDSSECGQYPDGVRVYTDGRREITTVRSRSLNHLDTLEMRQGNATVASTMTSSGGVVSAICTDGGHLKDTKSESDCTMATSVAARPLLAPPETVPATVTPPNTSPSPTYRRHMLSRSQKSSSECFSVNFEVGDEATYDTELFFPAARGVTLQESLVKLCELRNIELATCDVWLCDRESNVQSWLSLSQDTACLVGKHVKITAKDGRTSGRHLTHGGPLQPQLSLQHQQQHNKDSSHYFSHARKLSGNFRPRTSFFSSSTEECSTSVGDLEGSKKVSKQRWSTNLFGNSKEGKQSMEQLIEHLNHYSRYGVPLTPNYTLTRSDSHEALNKLEDDWREIIDVSELTDKQQKQQTALWELIKTEVAYIKTLKVVTDLFLACLINLQSSNILRDIDTNKLFSNISDILDANVQFWRSYLFPVVKEMRAYRKPPCLETMCDGFLKLKDCFQPYYRFCGEQSRCQHYCRENLTHNELFTAYLAWCETQKECNRLRLMDILVQPMQRLTKYGLLLKAILRNTDDDVDRDNLNIMIRSVDDFVNNVNFSLKQKQDNERLKGIIARIESYDIVETKDDDLEKLVKNYNQLDLTKPMIGCPPERRRHLLLEGDLKFKDSNTSKMEVHCFLLTDMLLVCKQSTKKGGATMRVIRMPYLIDKLVVTEVNKETPTLACVYKNELDMAIGAFLLQNSDAKKLKSWKEGIAKAQALYAQAKISFLPSTETAESVETDYSFEYAPENDYHYCLQAPRSPLASSSRASRVSSLAHSHSGSVEMNDQSSLGSCKAASVENDNRTASISSDEGVQALPSDQKSPSGGSSAKNSFKGHRIFHKTPNTLSVQPTYAQYLGQSLPNLALGSPNTLSNNMLSVPSTSKNGHLLSPTHRGISYPPPSPTRGNLRRGMAINQSKNPPLIKTRHVTSSASTAGGGEFDVPVIAGVSPDDVKDFGDFNRGYHRQAMKRSHRSDNKRYHTAGTVDDIKKEEASTSGIQKRSSWNCSSSTSNPEGNT